MKHNPASRLLRHALMAALLTTGCGLTAQTLTNSLAFYAPFSGGSLNDIAGGLTGNGMNGPTLQPSGGIGAGGGYVHLSNDGINPVQCVWYSDPTPSTNDFSIQLWVRSPDAYSPQNGQIEPDMSLMASKDWASGANVGWLLAREDGAADGDKFQWNMNTTGGSRKDFDPRNASSIVFDGNWHQIAITYQRSGNAIFYRDGVAMGIVSISANNGQSIRPALGSWVTNSVLVLGQDATFRYWHVPTSDPTPSSYNGDIDEPAMWSRVLTADEVLTAYVKGTNGLSLTSPLAPVFFTQPQGGTRYTSDNFQLTCQVAGDRGPLTYQWFKDGNLLTGATTRTTLLTNLTAGMANYSIVVNDGFGSITSAPATLTVLSASSVTNGMAVYLDFDGNIVAQAGTTISGTAIGNDPTEKYTNGIIGSAVIFNNDGSSPAGWSSDWAVSLGDVEWIYTNNWSFSLWVNEPNNANDLALMGNKNWTSGGNVGWVFAPYGTTALNYYAVGGPRRDIGGGNVLNSQWHHVACVFNRDANTTYVYVDGNLTASASLSQSGWESLTPTTFSPNATLVGSSGNQPYSGAGSIDDLGIWQRTLTPSEVLAIYAQGLVGQPLTTAIAGSAVRPLITSQPQGATVFEGGKATLSVAATGSTPLYYQWYKNGGLLSGGTTNSLLYYPVSTNNAGSYTVVVTNRYGAVTSSPPAVLSVTPITGIKSGLAVYLNFDNNIDAQGGTTNGATPVGNVGVPTYTNGIIGSAATFNNDDSDAANISDWAASLGNIEWLYNSSFSFAAWVMTTDTYGALLGNKNWYSGGNIGWVISQYRPNWLNYTAVGAARHDIGNFPWADGAWHHVAATFDRDANRVTTYVDGNATTNAPLGTTGLESLTPTDIMTTLVGSSGNGADSGFGAVDDLGMWMRPLSAQEILAVFVQGYNHEPLTSASTGAIKPFILNPPVAETRTEGMNTSFSVNAIGSAPLSYQWRRNGSDLIGETHATLFFPVATSDSGAGFTVLVTNPYGSITSSPPAILTVTPGPTAITNSLVVYLNFESNILAQAGTTINGTAVGNVGQEVYTAGKVGRNAALFNNDPNAGVVNDWAVSLGDIEWLYTNNWSFSLWVQTTDTDGAAIGNKDWASGANVGWLISEYYTDWLNYRPVNAPRHDIGNFNWADGVWHHVAAVFYRDGNQVLTYADGALTAEAPCGVTGYESLTPIAIMTTLVGSSGNGDYSFFGAVDDLGMWSRPLSQAEIVGIYQSGLKGLGVSQASYPQPSLTAVMAGGSLNLVYPGWAKGYTLESSLTLAPNSWGPVGVAPVIVNGDSVVTVQMIPGAQFFRLKH